MKDYLIGLLAYLAIVTIITLGATVVTFVVSRFAAQ